MLIIVLLLIAVITAGSFLEGDNKENVINEFCNTECKHNIKRKYEFCC